MKGNIVTLVSSSFMLGDQKMFSKTDQYGHGERGGEGEMCGKSHMEIYITICKIDRQWESAVWLRKLKQGLYINLEAWDGERHGREVQKREAICIPTADAC